MSILLNNGHSINSAYKGEMRSKIPQTLSTWFVHRPLLEVMAKLYYVYEECW